MKALRFAVLSLGMVAVPAIVQAQSCIGVPAGAGQYALEAGLGVGEGFKSYTGSLTANLSSPISLGVSGGLTQPDEGGEDMTSVGVGAAYELAQLGRLSVCPAVSASYSMMSSSVEGVDFDLNQIAVPVGLGFGTSLPAGRMNVTLFAQPQFIWYRTSASAGGESASETDNQFGLNGGVRFGTSSMFAGAGMSITSAEESEPVFSFGLGLVLGGRR